MKARYHLLQRVFSVAGTGCTFVQTIVVALLKMGRCVIVLLFYALVAACGSGDSGACWPERCSPRGLSAVSPAVHARTAATGCQSLGAAVVDSACRARGLNRGEDLMILAILEDWWLRDECRVGVGERCVNGWLTGWMAGRVAGWGYCNDHPAGSVGPLVVTRVTRCAGWRHCLGLLSLGA
jgi:hypothetical protein